jgi:hypothetical protein
MALYRSRTRAGNIEIPDFWKGWRNPVRYFKTLDELSLSLDGVHFEPVPETVIELEKTESESPRVSSGGLTIAEAKKGLALTFGVKPEAIEIIIHG